MKKHLLIGLSLFSAVGMYSQNQSNRAKPSGVENTAKKIAERFATLNNAAESPATGNSSLDLPEAPVTAETYGRTSSVSTFTTGWNSFTGSININGNLVSSSRPLQYNDNLCAISFIHRKSATYVMSPQPAAVGALSGGVVAMISKNLGTSWDSTLLWNNPNNWARYPQGAIYNPSINGTINTDINAAYITAMGPITTASSVWAGNFFASKSLAPGNYTNVAGTGNEQQFMPSTAPYGGLDKTVFSRYEMAATDDGKLHALGLIEEVDLTGYRGSRVVKGAFSAGVFTWTGDSIIPDVTTAPGDGSKDLIEGVQNMAWNESGTVGYVFHIGVRKNQTAPENKGFQPVIMKTINGGLSWSPISGIDFTQSSFVAPVMDHLLSTRMNTNVAVPFFNFSEGISAVVDKDDNLHIVASLLSSSSTHPDSLGFTFRFNNCDGETYKYPHTPGLRPYIYDFIGGATNAPWKVVLVDSMSSETPGSRPTDAGFGFNLWAADPTLGTKVVSDARIQASRTADGKYVVYTFTESDTTLTSTAGNCSVKWNQIPNVKARLYDVTNASLNTTRINVTRPSTPSLRNTNVASRAYFHYVAPTCILSQTVPVGPNGPAISLPMTVTNNGNLSGTDPVSHRFSLAALNFGNVAESDIYLACAASVPTNTTGISENQKGTVNSFIFPNPAKNSAVLSIDLKTSAAVDISVINIVGQVVKTSSTDAVAGNNIIPIDLVGLSKGIYMTTVKVNNVTSTKKLIVE